MKKFKFKPISYKIEAKKRSVVSCADVDGECDSSVGLSCQGPDGSKLCSCKPTEFFDTTDPNPICSIIIHVQARFKKRILIIF